MSTYIDFSNDVPLSTLPSDFSKCLENPSVACDAIVGSTTLGSGYCNDSQYEQTTYCACVNNSLPCPSITSTICSNFEYAYTPTTMMPPSGLDYIKCKSQPLCINLAEIGGSQNVVTSINQQCGVITNATNFIVLHPYFMVFLVILLIVISIIINNIIISKKH